MALSSGELSAQILQTQAFILADPTSIILRAVTKTADGKGGTKKTWPVTGYRAAQQFRLIPRSNQNDKVREVTTADGKVATVEFVLLGLPTDTMVQYDRFSWNGSLWEVSQIHENTSQYELKGDVTKIGS